MVEGFNFNFYQINIEESQRNDDFIAKISVNTEELFESKGIEFEFVEHAADNSYVRWVNCSFK